MTIDDAIDIEKNFSTTELKEYHSRLAEWLEELKALRSEKEYWNMQNHRAYQQGRKDTIDEFANALINDGKVSAMRVLKIKEKLKEKKND